MEERERDWMGSQIPEMKRKSSNRPKAMDKWKIRMKEEEFNTWRQTDKKWNLFFDGASKGNPGAAGAGGVLYSPGGNIENKFSWGLGTKSNNEAEALAILKGCQLATERNIQEVNIFGDSTIIIRGLLYNQGKMNANLECIRHRIKMEFSKIKKVKLYQIPRALNSEADKEANKGSSQAFGIMVLNGKEVYQLVP